MKRLFLIAAALLALGPVYAAELTALRRDQRLGARIQGLDLPASLRKELVSGLTNRLLIRISLRQNSQVLADAAVEIAVTYDLWDEVFHVKTTTQDRALTRTEASLDSTLRALIDLRLSDILDVPASGGSEPFVLQADLLLNPIDRERMDKIRRWVARNSTAAPGDSSGTTRTSTASSELFARIFEQYAAGKDMAAAWTRSLSSQPFRLNELSGDAP